MQRVNGKKRGNRYKMEQERSQLDVRQIKQLFTIRTLKQ